MKRVGPKMWRMHAGRKGEADVLFLQDNSIAFDEPLPDLASLQATRAAFRASVRTCYPTASRGSHASLAGQLFRFVHVLEVDDLLVYRSKVSNTINIGRVTGAYFYAWSGPGGYEHRRPVVWLKKSLQPSGFTQAALRQTRIPMTLIEVQEPFEFLAALASSHWERVADEDIQALRVEEAYEEGTPSRALVNKYERNAALRARAIEIHGTNCQVCGFNFATVYGSRGQDFIEVHHLKPVSSYQGPVRVNPKQDMAVVCANCHRMIHRDPKEPLSIVGMRSILATFSCGDPQLDTYFHQHAGQDEKRRLARTFVVREIESGIIAGFFTLSATSLLPATLTPDMTRKLPHYDQIPGMLLGRLAVDVRYQGVGSLLLLDAIARVERIEAGAHMIAVDAYQSACGFYTIFGFQALPGDDGRMILPMQTAMKAIR